MSQIINHSGEEDFHQGGLYSNLKDASLPLSLENQEDVFHSNKRACVDASFVIDRVNFEQKKKHTSLDVLPDECLYEIFKHLPGSQNRSIFACVSKRWLNIMINISKEDQCAIDDETMHGINDLEVEGNGFLTRSLKGRTANDVRLMALAIGTSGLGGLGKLMIKGTSSYRGVTNLGLSAIARFCPTLKVLSLWNVRSIGDEGVIAIAKGCPNLEKLDLRRCPTLTTNALLAIANNCLSLTTVYLDCCRRVGNEGLKAIGKLCRKVKSLTVKNCPLVTDKGITAFISSSSTYLNKLNLQGLKITNKSLAFIGQHGKSITELYLSNLEKVNETGFRVMGDRSGLQHLMLLTISSYRGVTDNSLEAIGRGCPNLKQVVLKKCALLSDNGLVSFIKCVRTLKRLQLEECHKISQTGYMGLVMNCGPKFKALAMTKCFGFRDKVPLPNVSTPIPHLYIDNCPGFLT